MKRLQNSECTKLLSFLESQFKKIEEDSIDLQKDMKKVEDYLKNIKNFLNDCNIDDLKKIDNLIEKISKALIEKKKEIFSIIEKNEKYTHILKSYKKTTI